MRSLKVYEIVNLFNWEEMIKKIPKGTIPYTRRLQK